MKTKLKRIGLAVSEETRDKFKAQADKRGITMTMYLTLLVEEKEKDELLKDFEKRIKSEEDARKQVRFEDYMNEIK